MNFFEEQEGPRLPSPAPISKRTVLRFTFIGNFSTTPPQVHPSYLDSPKWRWWKVCLEREREWERERERDCVRLFVCVCVCDTEREIVCGYERERGRICMCVCVCVRACVWKSVERKIKPEKILSILTFMTWSSVGNNFGVDF